MGTASRSAAAGGCRFVALSALGETVTVWRWKDGENERETRADLGKENRTRGHVPWAWAVARPSL